MHHWFSDRRSVYSKHLALCELELSFIQVLEVSTVILLLIEDADEDQDRIPYWHSRTGSFPQWKQPGFPSGRGPSPSPREPAISQVSRSSIDEVLMRTSYSAVLACVIPSQKLSGHQWPSELHMILLVGQSSRICRMMSRCP